MSAQPRSILITGASSGLGEALALRYAAPGTHLFLNGRNATRLDAVAGHCRERGAAVDTWAGDVTDADSLKHWIVQCNEQRPLNLVIANAGVALGANANLPFMISPERAADIIVRGLARNKARITFPWQVTLIARLCINLPAFIVDRINQPWGVPRLEDNQP